MVRRMSPAFALARNDVTASRSKCSMAYPSSRLRKRGSSAPFVIALTASLGVVMGGCGISMRYVVESDMRFEHCYRLDEDARTPVDQKRACWREWTATYQKGQDRSRVAYATDRLRVLDRVASGAPPAPTEGGASASTTIVLASTGSGMAPLSPYAPPPSIASNGAVNAVNDSPAWQTCSETCSKTWKACAPACGGQMPCVTACEERYRVCMKACF